MPSFDVVSRTDLMEVDNAISGAKREIRQRYDLAGSKCDVDRKDNALTTVADDHMKLEQVNALLRKYLTSRKVEIGAFVLIDTIVRLIPGVLGNPGSLTEETFEGNLLEYPQYTKPQKWEKKKVPDVLLTGDHG